ncbi:MAG: hypothetical protein ACYC1A_07225 [Spirochaetales bacterium]
MQNDKNLSKEELHDTLCNDINEVGNLLITLGKKLNGSEYINEMMYWEFQIFMKFIMNYCSIAHIRNGIPIPPNTNNKISDTFMLNTAIRTCLETYLLYQYIFCEKSESVKEFRFLCWIKEGLQTRIDYLIKNESLQLTQDKDKINIEILNDRIKSNSTFKECSDKRKNEVLKRHNWRPSWNKLLKDSDLPKGYKNVLYSSLSSYAHSESLRLSIFNNNDYINIARNEELALLPIVLIMAINVYKNVKLNYNIEIIETKKYIDIINKWMLNAVFL